MTKLYNTSTKDQYTKPEMDPPKGGIIHYMSIPEEFYDLLFEVSNEDRHKILIILQGKKMRTTDISNETGLNNPEVRRHISRLVDTNLIQRDSEGYYRLTPYGEVTLLLFHEIEFISKNNEYLKTHVVSGLPNQFLKQIGNLMDTRIISNTMDFFRYAHNLLKDSENHVWMLVDQFPMNLLHNIVEAIDRGVNIKIIESSEQTLIPDISALTSEESNALVRTQITPLFEKRSMDYVPLQFFLSESNCVLCFPTQEDHYDYSGFLGDEKVPQEWCANLFEYYWDNASPSINEQAKSSIIRGQRRQIGKSITVEGSNDPRLDAQAVQDAVDHYEEVILRGKFNFGTSKVTISKSVTIRGEGRKEDIPLTSIRKQGWSFPFREWASIFEINATEIDVVIENIHFTNYNCAAIQAIGYTRVNSVKILNNRMTIQDGYGRGISLAAFGDIIHGVLIEGVGSGDVQIEGNYIDLGAGGFSRGVLSRGGVEEDPEYRPDLFNHEYFIGFGIAINNCLGRVVIQDNVVRNANGRGIATSAHQDSTEVIIRNNEIFSEVFGSYPFSSRESGAGILVQTGLGYKNLPGFNVCIENNKISLEKVNQSGILVLGPTTEGSSKFIDGVIRENEIRLNNGYEGIHIRKCDRFDISGNRVSGEAYYGIHVSGHKEFGDMNMSSIQNQFKENDLKDLKIKELDDYVLNHSDGKMFTKREPRTAYYWLDQYTSENQVKLDNIESIIDEGENNTVTPYR